MTPLNEPDRVVIAPGLSVPRILTGLWQVADLERSGPQLDPEWASDRLIEYADAGFDGFDMADHYGSAEVIAGRAREKLLARDGSTRSRFLTKWCPMVDQHRPKDVRAGIQERLDRLGTESIDLLQLHWWTFEHPGWVDVMDELMVLKSEGKISALGVTNVDADHLHLMLAEGYDVATNQVSFSVVDRRAAGDLTEVCREHDVKLLAYGTLAGGFLTDSWLNAEEPSDVSDWSKMKYKRFIDQAGGWAAFQALLSALQTVAKRHDASIANVATRWVLEQEAVASIIVGARLGERQHRTDNSAISSFALREDDRAMLNAAFTNLRPIPGDCGDEYRRPPYLTASGDLSHHLSELPCLYEPVEVRPGRWKVSSGSVWEDVCGFSRACRTGNRVLVSGTTATHGAGRSIAENDVRGQTVFILDKIAAAIRAFGGSLENVVRTRIYMRDVNSWELAARVHGRYFADIQPANTLIEISNLVGPYAVEIEAEAELSDAASEDA